MRTHGGGDTVKGGDLELYQNKMKDRKQKIEVELSCTMTS